MEDDELNLFSFKRYVKTNRLIVWGNVYRYDKININIIRMRNDKII